MADFPIGAGEISTGAKVLGDTVAVSTVVGTLLSWLPPIAAGFSILWYIIRLYDRWEARRDRRKLPLED